MKKYIHKYHCAICEKAHFSSIQANQCFESHSISCLLCGETIPADDIGAGYVRVGGGTGKISFEYGSVHDGESIDIFICDKCWTALSGYSQGTPIVSECFLRIRAEENSKEHGEKK